jgi:hypothetical protein
MGGYETRVQMLPDGHTLVAERRFYLGSGGQLTASIGAYPSLKRVFDSFRDNDAATAVLAAPSQP